MESLESYQQNRRVIEDFAARTLAILPGDWSRLVYLASLRDLGTGRYEHSGLRAIYPEGAVQQGLKWCHSEVFAKLLETPLQMQARDLREMIGRQVEPGDKVLKNWEELESYRTLVPMESPGYLRELFYSNAKVLLITLRRATAGAPPAA